VKGKCPRPLDDGGLMSDTFLTISASFYLLFSLLSTSSE
jgi:hypothetical protein